MISSAVVIPEQEPEQQPPSPSLKRRQSSVSSDTSKRPRLDTQVSNENGTHPQSAGAMSPPSRRHSALGAGAAEEKKRGQRLFGALLGTLSQPSTKAAHRKRDEIEQRQRDRLRRDAEEREAETRRKREQLDSSRREEQKVWDEECMRSRHRNMRAFAGFLQTETEPKLYYKPWELRDVEEEQIRRQINDVEQLIRIELDGGDDACEVQVTRPEEKGEGTKDDTEGDKPASETPDQDLRKDETTQHEPESGDTSNEIDEMAPDELGDSNEQANNRKSAEDDRPKDDEHAGEELVEGQEDDVIY